MKRLDFCCFCVELELGGKIIGWLQLIGAGLGVISCGIAFFALLFIDTGGSKEIGIAVGLGVAIMIILLFMIIMSAFFSWKLIKGIEEKNYAKVRTSRIFFTVMTVLYLVLEFLKIIGGSGNINPHTGHPLPIPPQIIGLFISAILPIYFIYVIYSIEVKFNEGPMYQTTSTQPGVIQFPPNAVYQPGMTQPQGVVVQVQGPYNPDVQQGPPYPLYPNIQQQGFVAPNQTYPVKGGVSYPSAPVEVPPAQYQMPPSYDSAIKPKE